MTTAVLLMAYGSPNDLSEVEPYFTDIRGGRRPSPEFLADLTERYRRVGLPTPLLRVTMEQADALRTELGGDVPVYVGMKHWHPFIREAVEKMAAEGVERVIGIAAAPHFSAISVGGYEQRITRAREAVGGRFTLDMVPAWYEEPAFVELMVSRVRDALGDWDPSTVRVFFTAHSLPARIIEEGDPYRDQLLASARLIADAADIPQWEFAFQSQSQTGEPWLGPDILDALDAFAAGGGRRALVVPVGFVADHLEILFDIDVECVDKARELGIELRRTELPNADPRLARALAAAVRRAAG